MAKQKIKSLKIPTLKMPKIKIPKVRYRLNFDLIYGKAKKLRVPTK